MIFVKNEIYAKVWKIQRKEEKYMDVQVTTSEKGQDGEYRNSRWFPRLVGHAFNSLKDSLKEGDKIVITKAKLTNESYEAQDGTRKSAFKFVVLESNLDDSGASEDTSVPPTSSAQIESAAEDNSDPW
jgi:single-stranded DNA-binding protein